MNERNKCNGQRGARLDQCEQKVYLGTSSMMMYMCICASAQLCIYICRGKWTLQLMLNVPLIHSLPQFLRQDFFLKREFTDWLTQ